MADLVATLKLAPLLEAAGVSVNYEDFESLYSALASTGEHGRLLGELDLRIRTYFSKLRLPDTPTIYDHLVLSLRPKDTIVTFNWDPLLVQAIQRCARIAPPPRCYHLHGNVAAGYCIQHKPVFIGAVENVCNRCGSPLSPLQLLYPVGKKDYGSDALDQSWKCVQAHLRSAFLLTVFGYRAPSADGDAKALIKEGWGDSKLKSMEQIEIIDIRDEREVQKPWNPFFCRDHYDVHASFYNCSIAQFPRRSVEQMFDQYVDGEFVEYFPIPKDSDWSELTSWVLELLNQESATLT